MDVGKRIQDRRKELNLSVEELAKRLHKNRTTVYRYEKGDIENLPLDTLKPLADILQTTPAYLMGWEDKPSKDYEESIESKDDYIADVNTSALFDYNRLLHFRTWDANFNNLEFTDEEYKKIVEYAKFLVYARNDK